MDDILYTCACNFDKLSKYNYHFTLGNRKKLIVKIDMRFLKENFTHIIGLDHLTDIPDFNAHNKGNKRFMFEKIKNRKINLSHISKSNFYNHPLKQSYSKTNSSYTVYDRISALINIATILETSINGKFMTWDKYKCNIKLPDGTYRTSNIEADYLLAIPSPHNNNEHFFFFMYEIHRKKEQEKIINLAVHSAFVDNVDLTFGQDKSYTIMQVSRMHSKTKQVEILGTHPSYQKEKDEANKKLIPV